MFIQLYLITLPVFFAVDMIWLVLVAKNFYANQLGHLMSKSINWPAAISFYLLFMVGLVLFVIMPAIENKSYLQAIFYGAIFGLVTYATYDLTNLSTIKNWPYLLTFVDLAWGVILSALVSTIVYFVAVKVFGL